MHTQLLLTDLADMTSQGMGLPMAATGLAPPTTSGLVFPSVSRPDALDIQGWGLVVPENGADDLLAWTDELAQWRMLQCRRQPDELTVFRVPPQMTQEQASAWIKAHYVALPLAQRPRYLLVLGDLHQVSLELQRALMASAFVGRLCFTDPDGQPDANGYRAYGAKVRVAEGARASWDDDARLLLYACRSDRDSALEDAYTDLIRRCALEAKSDPDACVHEIRRFGRYQDHQWFTTSAEPEDRQQTLWHWAESAHPSILLSVTHGGGTLDPVRQRLQQGALIIEESRGQERREVWDHERFATSPFLPNGFWFVKACFGAGTPDRSLFEPWLRLLAERARTGVAPAEALTYLAPADKGFVARLPQVALANPRGPLGLLGHVDLSWSYGYQDPADDQGQFSDSAHTPYYEVLRAVAMGSRLGHAVSALTVKAGLVATELAQRYGARELRLEADSGTPDHDAARRAWLWMQRLDLSSYVLLGDPAVQLPTAEGRALAEAEEQTSARRRRRAGQRRPAKT